MTDLRIFSPRTSWPDILCGNGNGNGLNNTFQAVTDGYGHASGLQLSLNGVKVNGTFTLSNAAGEPPGALGMMYYDTTANKFRGYTNSGWQDFTLV